MTALSHQRRVEPVFGAHMVQRKEQIRVKVEIRESTSTGGNPAGSAANGCAIVDVIRQRMWFSSEALFLYLPLLP